MSNLLDGKILAQKIKDDLKVEIENLKCQYGVGPSMVSILVGDDSAALAYAGSQKRAAEALGIPYRVCTLALDISPGGFTNAIEELNRDESISGIMLFKPLPSHLNYQEGADKIRFSKDIEGVSLINIGKLLMGNFSVIPCTPASVMEHIRSTGISLVGKEAVVVGRSEIVGKPVALLLLKEGATVTVCHSKTVKLEDHLRRADIVVAAVGQPNFIKGEWIKSGAIVIDVGINRVGERIVGDVEFESAAKRAGFITPVPGGVGPITAVMLMKNAVQAFKFQKEWSL